MSPPTVTVDFSRADQLADPFGWTANACRYRVVMDGDRVGDIEIPWPALLPLLAELDGARSLAVMEQVGRMLRDALGTAGWERAEDRLTQAMYARTCPVLQITSHAAEITLLPWELVQLGATGQALGQSPVLLRYAWPGTKTIPADPTPGGIVFAWSAAGGAVPEAEHRRAIAEASAQHGVCFDETQDVLPNVSLRALAERLARPGAPVTALHLLCHGTNLRAAPGSFGLRIDAPGLDPNSGEVDGAALAAVLSPYAPTLRLVVICACRAGGYQAGLSRLGSVAIALHRAGLQTVIASRAQLSIDGAGEFTARLYPHALREGAMLEQAFLAARAALNVHPARRDWVDVQLLGRAADGDETRLSLTRAEGAPADLAAWLRRVGVAPGSPIVPDRLESKLRERGKKTEPLDALLRSGLLTRGPMPSDPRLAALEDVLVEAWDLLATNGGVPAPPSPIRRWIVRSALGLAVTIGSLWQLWLPDRPETPPVEIRQPPPRGGDSSENGGKSKQETGAAGGTGASDGDSPGPLIHQGGVPPNASDRVEASPAAGRISLVTRNGVNDKTHLSILKPGDQSVLKADDTILEGCLAAGEYVAFARRVPGEAPVRQKVPIRAGQTTTLCLDLDPPSGLDLDPPSGLCGNTSVDITPTTNSELCP